MTKDTTNNTLTKPTTRTMLLAQKQAKHNARITKFKTKVLPNILTVLAGIIVGVAVWGSVHAVNVHNENVAKNSESHGGVVAAVSLDKNGKIVHDDKLKKNGKPQATIVSDTSSSQLNTHNENEAKPATEQTTTVQQGEGAYRVATNAGITVTQLQSLNPGVDITNLVPGQTLKVG